MSGPVVLPSLHAAVVDEVVVDARVVLAAVVVDALGDVDEWPEVAAITAGLVGGAVSMWTRGSRMNTVVPGGGAALVDGGLAVRPGL